MNSISKEILVFIFLFFPFIAHAEDLPKRKTVCLNMIVKNESKVITRCLSTVLPLIDYWVIVDTGSTDGTQGIIKDFMQSKGIPGELPERPWKNFAYNRNEALNLAKGKADYVLFIDADELLVYEPDFKLPDLDKDYYYITTNYSGTRYARIGMIKNDLEWAWVGVLHEVLCPPASRSFATLEKVTNTPTPEGARSRDPEKYQKDAQVLEAALKEEPNNQRYVFYLAQSYADAGNDLLALQNYEKRIKMGGWDQEVYWSMLKVAMLQENLEMPSNVVINSYNRAYQYRKSRIEPLYHMANYFRDREEYAKAYAVAKIGSTLPPTNDLLFVQQ